MKDLLKNLSDEEILSFIGYAKCRPDETMMRDIEEMKERVIACSTPRYVIREFEWENNQLKGVSLRLQGNDIQRLLRECHRCIFLAATLGKEIDVEMKRLQLKDMGKAVIFDCCANAAIEHVCDQIQKELDDMYRKEGLYLSDRYSCGYGDLPLTIQPAFLKVLDAQKKAGIYTSESCILHPMKSVTAIIGIAKTMQPALLRGCQYCSFHGKCTYQKGGNRCGKC